MLPTKEKFEEMIEILQCIMRIQDWDISLRLINDHEMQGIYGKKSEGCNVMDKQNMHSVIYLNTDLIDTKTSDFESFGWYNVLIHEMMHIIHITLDDWIEEHLSKDHWANYELEMERNLNRFARVFISVYPAESLLEGCEENEDSDVGQDSSGCTESY